MKISAEVLNNIAVKRLRGEIMLPLSEVASLLSSADAERWKRCTDAADLAAMVWISWEAVGHPEMAELIKTVNRCVREAQGILNSEGLLKR